MKVLIADKFEQSGIDGLKSLGCDVLNEPELVDQALVDRIGSSGAEALVVRSTKVTAAMMTGALKLIVRAGAGVNTIDVKAATAKGIQVANCPGKNAIAVAELAMGLMLSLDRRIPDNVADLRAGTWNKKEYSKARGLYGKTLGVLGAGAIAREVIRRAAAFGMPVVICSLEFDRQDRPMTEADARLVGLEEAFRQVPISLAPSAADLASRCDILTLHVALVPETRHMVNAGVLSRLKPGSFLINTSRAEVVDQDALKIAIRERKLRVGLDVFAAEPAAATGAFADAIVQEPGVYGTHHIGASTDQAQEAIAVETVRIVRKFRATGKAPNAVNG
jgi:D-3-phosphoglycerate dehydrogenase